MQRNRGEVEQPGLDHAAAAPELGHRAGVDIKLIELRLLQGSRFGVGILVAGTGVGIVKDVQSFRQGGHHAVLDPVMDHLYEVASSTGTAVQVALLGGARCSPASRGSRRRVHSGGYRGEDRLQVGVSMIISADHQAVATLQPEHPSAGAAVDQLNPALGEVLCSADVIPVVGVAAINDDVALLHLVGQLGDGGVGDVAGWNHHPGCPGRGQLGHELGYRGGPGRSLRRQLLDSRGVDIEDDALVAVPHQPADQIGSHPSQTHHA